MKCKRFEMNIQQVQMRESSSGSFVLHSEYAKLERINREMAEAIIALHESPGKVHTTNAMIELRRIYDRLRQIQEMKE